MLCVHVVCIRLLMTGLFASLCMCITHTLSCLSVYRSSESNQALGAGVEFVPVEQFDQKGVRTHICEVHKKFRFLPKRLNGKNSQEHVMQLPVHRYRNPGIDFGLLPIGIFRAQVQLMMESFHTMKVEQCHTSFVKARNLLSQ